MRFYFSQKKKHFFVVNENLNSTDDIAKDVGNNADVIAELDEDTDQDRLKQINNGDAGNTVDVIDELNDLFGNAHEVSLPTKISNSKKNKKKNIPKCVSSFGRKSTFSEIVPIVIDID